MVHMTYVPVRRHPTESSRERIDAASNFLCIGKGSLEAADIEEGVHLGTAQRRHCEAAEAAT